MTAERVAAQEPATLPMLWLDAGPLSQWMPVMGRYARPVYGPVVPVRYVLARTTDALADPTSARWIELQRAAMSAVPDRGGARRSTAAREPRRYGELVFWRLAARTRAFAIDVSPSPTTADAIARAERVVRRSDALEVRIGFAEGDPLPRWVAHDAGELLFTGLPGFHLVRTSDPGRGLAAILSSARILRAVRDLGVGRLPVQA